MKTYITTVAAAAIMAAFADNLVPQKWQKYISLLTGALLLVTLITPLLKLRKIEIPKLNTNENTIIEYDISKEVATELTKKIEEDIKKRLWEEFAVKATAEAELDIKDDKIGGVKRLILYCEEQSAITARLTELYGCNNIQYYRRKK